LPSASVSEALRGDQTSWDASNLSPTTNRPAGDPNAPLIKELDRAVHYGAYDLAANAG
jgi:hypothetical protein